MKLDDVDILAGEKELIRLLGIALPSLNGLFRKNVMGFGLEMSLINDTLVLQTRSKQRAHTFHKISDSTLLRDPYDAATVPVPVAEPNPIHYRLLRYNIGPLSVAVRTKANGSVQELPTIIEPSEPPRTRDVHGIDVITAGQGVLTPTTFHAIAKPEETNDPWRRRKRELEHLKRWVPLLWVSGQTKEGVLDIIRTGRGADSGGLTVVELGDKVRAWEEGRQDGFRRLPGLLAMLRDTVRAHGGPCIAVFSMPKGNPGSIQTPGSSGSPGNYTLQIHSAVPQDDPMLLDWHKEHFWSKSSVSNEHDEPQEKSAHEHARPQKGVIRQ